MHLEDDFLNPEKNSDPEVIFERNLSMMEEEDPTVISIVEQIHGIPRKLYFQKGTRFLMKKRKRIVEKYITFLGSSLGYKSAHWEKYNIRLDPGQKLHLVEYMKVKHLFDNAKKLKKD